MCIILCIDTYVKKRSFVERRSIEPYDRYYYLVSFKVLRLHIYIFIYIYTIHNTHMYIYLSFQPMMIHLSSYYVNGEFERCPLLTVIPFSKRWSWLIPRHNTSLLLFSFFFFFSLSLSQKKSNKRKLQNRTCKFSQACPAHTKYDILLLRLTHFVMQGWRTKIDEIQR